MSFLHGLAIVAALSLAFPDDPGRRKLPEQEVPRELAPKTITLQGSEIPLSKALDELAKQTGNRALDRRQAKDDLAIKLDLRNATFWQALDAIARAANARISLYEKDALVCLADGPYVKLPTSYHGLFRVTAKGIVLNRSFESDLHLCTIHLEVAWEPRFQPFMLENRNGALVVKDDKGRPLVIPEMGQGMSSADRRVAKEIQLQVAAPPRSAASLGLLKGAVTVVGPGKMLTFKFDKLARIEKREEARTQTQEGVSVSLREVRPEGEGAGAIWTIGVLLEYPAAGPKFESFQSWFVNNEIYLEKDKNGSRRKFLPNRVYETDESTDTRAILRSRFGDDPAKNLVLGNFSDWNLVYRTPGKIISIDVPFVFKDVPLP